MLAVELSGLVAARVMTWVWGTAFVFAGPPGTTFPVSACAYLLSIHPAAGSCSQAYLDENWAAIESAPRTAGQNLAAQTPQ